MSKERSISSLLAVIVVLAATLVLSLLIFKIGKDTKFETFGQFGDFYGGVLGTIITFVGLYFIFGTYKQQQEQLDVAKKDSDLEIINKLYNDLINEINSIQYRKGYIKSGGLKVVNPNATVYQGIDALYNFDEHHDVNPNSVVNHLNSILLSFEHILLLTKQVKFKYQDMKEIMMTKIYFLFQCKIIWPAESIFENKESYNLTRHSDGIILFEAYEKLTRESINYLIEKGRINPPSNHYISSILKI